MSRLDRYILRLLAGPFLFFVLVFTGVIWLSQSLRVIDMVVNNGQSAAVFLEFTALLLPTVMTVVLPLSAFAAALTAFNRMVSDSETVVLQAAGISRLALMRPIGLFCLGVTAAMFAVTLYAQPAAKRELRERVTEVRGDLAAAFLREGAFVTPVRGVTVYLREMGRPGELLGIFVHDERDPGRVVTYTAERALLVQDADPPVLVMFDGVAQSVDGEGEEALSLLRFERFDYDLGHLTREQAGALLRKPSERFLPELLTITEEEAGRWPLGEYRAEAHEALTAPLYALVLPILGAATVLGAGFRRGGMTGRIALAAGAGLGLRLAGLAAKSAVSGAAALWPLLWLPPGLALGAALWLLAGWRLPAWRRPRAGAAGA